MPRSSDVYEYQIERDPSLRLTEINVFSAEGLIALTLAIPDGIARERGWTFDSEDDIRLAIDEAVADKEVAHAPQF